nr:hypothetical protein GCM10020185_80200 [Pseudomonas brassicacearum subsp. brassicacearum]
MAGTRETYERLYRYVLERLPAPGSWSRGLVDWALAAHPDVLQRHLGDWLVRRPLRDVLGFSRTRAPLLVGDALPPETQAFFSRHWVSGFASGAMRPTGKRRRILCSKPPMTGAGSSRNWPERRRLMTQTAATHLLELDHISLSFKGVKAVTDISFRVATGEICALIGPNGAGKSSLLNVISGVYQAQEGRIRF